MVWGSALIFTPVIIHPTLFTILGPFLMLEFDKNKDNSSNKPKVWSVQLEKSLNLRIKFPVPPSTTLCEAWKKFCSKKEIWVQKNFGFQKNFEFQKNFGFQKNVGSQKNFGPKKFWDWKNFGFKKFWFQKMFYWKKLRFQKFFWSNFGSKKFLVRKKLWVKRI